MNDSLKKYRDGFVRLLAGARYKRKRIEATESPLRAELFSAEQMDEHGRTLAAFHRVQAGRGRNRLLARLDENEIVLIDTCALLSTAIRENRRVTPASEWLLDNYYLIDEHVRTARLHFPKGYSFQLPRLANGMSAGLPRIYDIALNAISHGDGRFDQDSLHRFVAAYQRTAPLSLGELWAIPIMLRLALIENLRRVASRVALDRRHRNLAAYWGESMAEIAAHDPKSLILAVADMARSDPPASSSFVAELMQRLQNQSASLAVPVSWLEQRLAEAGVTIEQLVQSENQQQAADQMSVSNSIGSLRLLLSTDWRGFVEGLSLIETTLATDPAGVYANMSFTTRDAYRHVVERIARKAGRSEADVAEAVVELAVEAARDEAADAPRAHVGYYLIDAGLATLERRFGRRATVQRIAVPIYLGAIALLTAAIAGIAFLLPGPTPPAYWAALVAAPLVLAASQLALVVVNWLAAFVIAPKTLPRMDYALGIPAEATTLVVVPTLLGSAQAAQEEVDDLEIRYLANRVDHLHFALLGDYPDAAGEHASTDEQVLAAAVAGIERLNRLYADAGGSRFFLLHRRRRWNAGEGVWMGEERKRGKLGDLNALLRDGTDTPFARIVGDPALLRTVRYVITLDADTRLPHDVAHKLVATMRHPLNRARFDAARGRVVSGYGILQPRVGTTLPLAGASGYAMLFGGDPGLDPYTRAVSDVYQDLFGEGSFIG
ncbi:MAG TPA: cyclic beta 1-2 glucan synthetase, partial [Rhodanobacteraceae bacterium]|nr:cyclic beta 1-2 glucan synthetase [Rhodanobacteraceae bacterium]